MATSRGWKSDARAVAESVLLRRETNRDVRVGSIASFWTLADDFRTTPGNGHRQGRSAYLKGADKRHPKFGLRWKEAAN